MNPEMEALARRAVVATGGRWLPGVRVINPRLGDARIVVVADDGSYFVFKEARGVEGHRDPRDDDPADLPDLTDPATLGCLLALVREAWNKPELYAYPVNGLGWVVGPRFIEGAGWCPLGDGASEAAALVCALESAPAREVQR